MGMELLRNNIIWDVIPGLAMVLMEGITVVLTIMTKTVMARGMSPFVFIAYTNILSTLILLPSFFFFHRPQQSFFNLSLLSKFFFLGLIGVTLAQNFAFMGLSFSSPIVVATMANQLPGFSFLLSIVTSCGQVEFRRSSTQAKTIGTVVSIFGAVFVAMYKGPALWKPSTYQLFLSWSPRPLFLFGSTPESWVLGCILLAIATLCASVWNIIQMQTVKEFPEPTTIVTLYSLFRTIQCVLVSLIAERDPSAWLITDKMELNNILLSAFFGSIVRSTVQGWCVRTKGPLFIAMFKPFTVFIAVSFGFMFFGHTFHFGRCQPWTIALTGVSAIGGSWIILHSVIISAVVVFLISAWWYIFLYSYPKMEILCFCGVKCVVLTSHTDRNPDRDFLKCAIGKCKMWCWVDKLKKCPCGGGYCQSVFLPGDNCWVYSCPLLKGGKLGCGFKEFGVSQKHHTRKLKGGVSSPSTAEQNDSPSSTVCSSSTSVRSSPSTACSTVCSSSKSVGSSPSTAGSTVRRMIEDKYHVARATTELCQTFLEKLDELNIR